MSTTITDAELIAQFIATRGVTRCPAAFAAPTSQVNLTREDRDLHRARVTDEPAKLAYGRKSAATKPPSWAIKFTPEMDETIRTMLGSGRPVRGGIDKALGISWLPIHRRAGELGLAIAKHGSGLPQNKRAIHD